MSDNQKKYHIYPSNFSRPIPVRSNIIVCNEQTSEKIKQQTIPIVTDVYPRSLDHLEKNYSGGLLHTCISTPVYYETPIEQPHETGLPDTIPISNENSLENNNWVYNGPLCASSENTIQFSNPSDSSLNNSAIPHTIWNMATNPGFSYPVQENTINADNMDVVPIKYHSKTQNTFSNPKIYENEVHNFLKRINSKENSVKNSQTKKFNLSLKKKLMDSDKDDAKVKKVIPKKKTEPIVKDKKKASPKTVLKKTTAAKKIDMLQKQLNLVEKEIKKRRMDLNQKEQEIDNELKAKTKCHQLEDELYLPTPKKPKIIEYKKSFSTKQDNVENENIIFNKLFSMGKLPPKDIKTSKKIKSVVQVPKKETNTKITKKECGKNFLTKNSENVASKSKQQRTNRKINIEYKDLSCHNNDLSVMIKRGKDDGRSLKNPTSKQDNNLCYSEPNETLELTIRLIKNKSETHIQNNNRDSDNTNVSNIENSSFTDLSFLDDIDVDEIVEILNTSDNHQSKTTTDSDKNNATTIDSIITKSKLKPETPIIQDTNNNHHVIKENKLNNPHIAHCEQIFNTQRDEVNYDELQEILKMVHNPKITYSDEDQIVGEEICNEISLGDAEAEGDIGIFKELGEQSELRNSTTRELGWSESKIIINDEPNLEDTIIINDEDFENNIIDITEDSKIEISSEEDNIEDNETKDLFDEEETKRRVRSFLESVMRSIKKPTQHKDDCNTSKTIYHQENSQNKNYALQDELFIDGKEHLEISTNLDKEFMCNVHQIGSVHAKNTEIVNIDVVLNSKANELIGTSDKVLESDDPIIDNQQTKPKNKGCKEKTNNTQITKELETSNSLSNERDSEFNIVLECAINVNHAEVIAKEDISQINENSTQESIFDNLSHSESILEDTKTHYNLGSSDVKLDKDVHCQINEKNPELIQHEDTTAISKETNDINKIVFEDDDKSQGDTDVSNECSAEALNVTNMESKEIVTEIFNQNYTKATSDEISSETNNITIATVNETDTLAEDNSKNFCQDYIEKVVSDIPFTLRVRKDLTPSEEVLEASDENRENNISNNDNPENNLLISNNKAAGDNSEKIIIEKDVTPCKTEIEKHSPTLKPTVFETENIPVNKQDQVGSNATDKPNKQDNASKEIKCKPKITQKIQKLMEINVTPPAKVLAKKPKETKCTASNKHAIETAVRKENELFARYLENRIFEYLHKKYTVNGIITDGHFSKIFFCESRDGETLAAKVLKKQFSTEKEGFKKELKLKEILKDGDKTSIANLVSGLCVLGRWCFLFEYYPQNLKQALWESGRSFHIDTVQVLARQLLAAVFFLRKHCLVHLAIKPGHILINVTQNKLKLCGFDDARSIDQLSDFVWPEPDYRDDGLNYRAPEMILGYQLSYSVDVWSAALVIHEMATNMKLFTGNTTHDVLFNQMRSLGSVPHHMLSMSANKHNFFRGNKLIRTHCNAGKEKTVLITNNYKRTSRLSTLVFQVYNREWRWVKRFKNTVAHDKVRQMTSLLDLMLAMYPNNRIPIEFAYADPFIYEYSEFVF